MQQNTFQMLYLVFVINKTLHFQHTVFWFVYGHCVWLTSGDLYTTDRPHPPTMISRRRATLPMITRSFLTRNLSCSGTIFELVRSVTCNTQRETWTLYIDHTLHLKTSHTHTNNFMWEHYYDHTIKQHSTDVKQYTFMHTHKIIDTCIMCEHTHTI